MARSNDNRSNIASEELGLWLAEGRKEDAILMLEQLEGVLLELGGELAHNDMEGLGILLVHLTSYSAKATSISVTVQQWANKLHACFGASCGGKRLTIVSLLRQVDYNMRTKEERLDGSVSDSIHGCSSENCKYAGGKCQAKAFL